MNKLSCCGYVVASGHQQTVFGYFFNEFFKYLKQGVDVRYFIDQYQY